ncbi:trichohyalin [Poecilia reticulata]|uniref:trichohyalin n=1 Tax=Poecilia reticulata TaxID=8081 RepID=UPI0004A368CF|nr:PREDICTED: leucine-, glutamate- and lysine-rich protein 1 [Poecilia reticulata]
MDYKKKPTEEKLAENEQMKILPNSPPLYPLPEEIIKMERNETKCDYCGVSYLTLYENRQLQSRLALLEAELQEWKETAQREQAQLEAWELNGLEQERELQAQVDVREKTTRDELEKRYRDMTKTLKDEFEAKFDRMRNKMKADHQKIIEEKERQLRRELEDLMVEKLGKQREELKKSAEERETVLRTDLKKAKEISKNLKKNLHELRQRLGTADDMKDEAQEKLGKEKQNVETLKGARARLQQILQKTLIVLHFCGSGFTDLQGFLHRLTGAWQTFSSQILQHCKQGFSELSKELRHSTVELQKAKEENGHLTQQLMEQKTQWDEQLLKQEDAEKEYGQKLLRLTVEVEEKNKKWLLCQQRCDAMEKQLLSWEQREEELNQKWHAAGEEVMQTREILEKIWQENGELIKERDILIESHDRAVISMKYNHSKELASMLASALEEERLQSSLHLQKKLEELRREADLQLKTEREKRQALLSELRLKLEEERLAVQHLRRELHQERKCRDDQRTEEAARERREKGEHRQGQQKLSQAKCELALVTEKNVTLTEEVAFLEDTVWKECEEREELTAALSQAQQELFGLQSIMSPRSSTGSFPNPPETRATPGNKSVYPQGNAGGPLPVSPASLQPPSACTDKDRGLHIKVGGAEESLESRKGDGGVGGAKKQEGKLPRLKTSGAEREVRRKVRLMMGKTEML